MGVNSLEIKIGYWPTLPKKSTGNAVEEDPGVNHCRCLTKLVLHMSEKKFLSTEGEYTRKEYAKKFLEFT